MVKNILVFARKSMKLTILLFISILLIICAVVLFFKPIYTVSINGEQVGYSKNKTKLHKYDLFYFREHGYANVINKT